MPNLLNQSKHDESEPRLALQIRNQEQKRSRRGVDEEHNEVFRIPVRKFAPGCEKIRTSAKLMMRNVLSPLFVDFFILFSPFPLLPSLFNDFLRA